MTIAREGPLYRLVRGRVTLEDSGRPATGVRVTVLDAALGSDEALAEAVTNENGEFESPYDAGPFRERFGRLPEVYLLLHDDGRLLTTTRDAVVRDAGDEQVIEVQLRQEDPRPGPVVTVGGRVVDARAFERLRPADIVALAGTMLAPENGAVDGSSRVAERAAAHGDQAAELLSRLRPWPVRDLIPPQLCLTPLVHFLIDLVRTKRWGRETLLAFEKMLVRSHDVSGMKSHPCPPFIVYYRIGPGGVSPDDSAKEIVVPGTSTVVGRTSANGVPDYVERVCFWLQQALNRYTGPPLSLRAPMKGGGTIRVRISADFTDPWAEDGWIELPNALSYDELAMFCVHELMHLVQEEYEGGGKGPWHPGREGGACVGEDLLVDPLNRYIVEADDFGEDPGTLAAPDQSLETLIYEQSLFLKYLTEQHSPRAVGTGPVPPGADAYRVLLESFDALGYTAAAVERAVGALPGHPSFYRFAYVDGSTLDEVSSETLLGNFWLACYLKALGRGVPDRRFDFEEAREPALIEVIQDPPGTPRLMRDVALKARRTLAPGGTITLSSGDGAVPRFGARFYRVDVHAAVDTLRVTFRAGTGLTRPLVQIVEVETNNRVRDILRSDREEWVRTIASTRSGTPLDHLLVVVSGTDTGGKFSLSVQEVAPAPNVMVTHWNRRPGTHYEIDPLNWAWTWISPDLWVDTNQDGVADGEVRVGQNNRLLIRLRNQGNRAATGIQVDFWYQEPTGGLRDAAWERVRNTAGNEQVLTGLTLSPQSENRWGVDWAPAASFAGRNFSVRAVVTVPGDPNTDNKRAISSVGTVVMENGQADLELVRRPFQDRFEVETVVIPRTRGRFGVSRSDLERVNSEPVLGAGQRVDRLRVRRLTRATSAEHDREPSAGVHTRRIRVPPQPDPYAHHPTDACALPPGTGEVELITVVHRVEGRVIGGFTWVVRGPSEAPRALPGGDPKGC